MSDLRAKLKKKHFDRYGIRICLTMIVKNESKIIERLIKSLVGVIDMICITDTGSTDRTPDVILKLGEKLKIPTTVHKDTFRDFGSNRTKSLINAKKSYPNADYYLLSDADFIWEVNGFDKNKLTCLHGYVKQDHGSLVYYNTRLLSSKIDWVCEGVTHEYWTNVDKRLKFEPEKIQGLTIKDLGDGGSKTDKFIRDEKLLRMGLEDPKTNKGLRERYTFYLSNTLRDLGKYEEAIERYKDVFDNNYWVEEKYEALYNIGLCYERMNDKDNAHLYYMKSYEFRPTRAEGLYRSTVLHREDGENEEAYKLASIGVKIPLSTDILFVDKEMYGYAFEYELSIVCYYIPERRSEGIEYIKKILANPLTPKWMKEVSRKNLSFYEK